MNQDAVAVLFVVWILIALAWMVMRSSRAEAMVDRFVKGGGYRLLRKERRTLFRGPFFFSTGRGQEVFYLTLEDREGHVRRCYLRCGGAFFGMLSDNVEVIWDEPRRPPPPRPEPPGFPVILLNKDQSEER